MRTVALILLLASARLAAAAAPVADAAMDRDNAAVSRLLQDGADVNLAQADGATALHWAAYHRDADLTLQLLEAGANVAAANRNGSTPLWLASSQASDRSRLCSQAARMPTKNPGRRPLMLAPARGRRRPRVA
jgi:hypothetical protein